MCFFRYAPAVIEGLIGSLNNNDGDGDGYENVT